MPDDFYGSDSAVKYEAVCQSCGHRVDLPQGQSYYRGSCPMCGKQMSVEVGTGTKAASLPYVHFCLRCGFQKRASWGTDTPSYCPSCNDTMLVIGCVSD